MSFEYQVEQHHKLQYAGDAVMVAQQLQNPLRNAVTIVSANGEAMSTADLMGEEEYVRGKSRDTRNPEVGGQDTRRWLVYPEYAVEHGKTIFKEDTFKKMMDPSGNTMRKGIAAVERGIFDTILGIEKKSNGTFSVTGSGIMGRATEGARPGAASELPAGNTIVHGGIGLNTEKLRTATEAMELENFGLETEDEIFALISPKQKTDLLNLALATKVNLNQFDIDQIKSGRPTSLLGITWMFSNRVPVNAAGNRLVPIWSKSNIVAGFWQDLQSQIWNNPERKNLPYVFTDALLDCVRHQDGGVRIVECVET